MRTKHKPNTPAQLLSRRLAFVVALMALLAMGLFTNRPTTSTDSDVRAPVRTKRKPNTAAKLLSSGQAIVAAGVVLLAVVEGALRGPLSLLKTAVALVIVFYVLFVGLSSSSGGRRQGRTGRNILFQTLPIPGFPGTRSWCRFAGKQGW